MYTKTMYQVYYGYQISMAPLGDKIEYEKVYDFKYFNDPIEAYNFAVKNSTVAVKVEVLTLEEPKNKVHIFCDGTTKTWRKIHSIGNDDYCKCEDNENVGEKCTTCGYMKYVGRQIDPRT